MSQPFESNIIECVYMKELQWTLRKQKFYEEEKKIQRFMIIVLWDLAFAFGILGIRSVGATVVFSVEDRRGR